MFRSTKTYDHNIGLSACFRQHRAKSHCRFLHGYALAFRFEFEAATLDENGWVVDFGSLKPLKAALEELFDHKTLVAKDDPNIDWYQDAHRRGIIDMQPVDAMGVEAFAKMAYDLACSFVERPDHAGRVRVAKVECREHAGNSAIYEPEVG